MANDTLAAPQTAAALFQQAHSRMTNLQRIDEQIAALVQQRRKIEEELRAVQGLINEEFDRVVRTGAELPQRMLAQVAALGSDAYSSSASPKQPAGASSLD